MYRITTALVRVFALMFISVSALSQIPAIDWVYNEDVEYLDRVEQMMPTSDGGYLAMVRYTSQSGDAQGFSFVAAMKLNADGGFLWRTILYQSYMIPPLIKPIELIGGGYLVRGAWDSAHKLNPTTGAIMTTAFCPNGAIVGMAQQPGGKIGLAYTAYDGSKTNYGLKVITSAFADVSDNSYGGTGDDTPNSICIASNFDSFIIGGNSNSPASGHKSTSTVGSWVLAVNSYGNIDFERSTTNTLKGLFAQPYKNLGETAHSNTIGIISKDLTWGGADRYYIEEDVILYGTSAGKGWINWNGVTSKFNGTITSMDLTEDGRMLISLSDSLTLVNSKLTRLWRTTTYKNTNIALTRGEGILVFGGNDFYITKTEARKFAATNAFFFSGLSNMSVGYTKAKFYSGAFVDVDANGVQEFIPLGKGQYESQMDEMMYIDLDASSILKNTNGRFKDFKTLSFSAGQFANPVADNWLVRDFDNDGSMEIFLNPLYNISATGDITTVTTSNLPASFDGPNNEGTKWADFDNNGLLDVAVNGNAIYKQTSVNVFEKVNSTTTMMAGISSPLLVDINNDSFVDIITGTKIYINNQNLTFTLSGTTLTYFPKYAVELNGDGYLDLLGDTHVFINSGTTTFTYKAHGLTNPVPVGDINNDGRIDLAAQTKGAYFITFNDGAANFPGTVSTDYLLPTAPGSIPVMFPGHFDDDGDVDLVTVDDYQTIFLTNGQVTMNSAPTAPTAPTSSKSGNVVTMSWTQATDDTTPAASLSYNVYVKNGAQYVLSPSSILASGKRLANVDGNAGLAKQFKIVGLPVGTYKWGVQSIDKSLLPSAFCAEQTFYITTTPTDISLSAATIAENSAATIGTLSTTDPDVGETWTYTLVSGTGSTDNALFKITGNALSALSATSLNFETKSSYSIRIRSTDSRQAYFEKVLTITVTNVQEAATNITLSSSAIAENLVVGTTVGTLTNNDPDAGDTFTYTLVTGTGDTDNASFEITGATLKTKSVFNYELKTSYSIRIQVKDQGNLSFQKQFTISITDVNDLIAPVITIPTAVSQTGFSIGWNSIEGATSYEVELSTDNFSNLVSGYNPKSVTGTSLIITGLNSGITYQIRIRAAKSADKSPYSATVPQLTKPGNPVVSDAQQVDVTSFKIAWPSVTGATSYELEVSAGNGAFTPMAGYNPKVITGALDQFITDLTGSTVYKYRMKAVNASGKSEYSTEKSTTTLAPPVIRPVAAPTQLTFSGVNINSATATFLPAAGSPEGYIAIMKAGTAPTEKPTDGVVYTVNQSMSSSTVVFSGPENTFSLSNLQANTKYSFRIFSFNGALTNRLYKTDLFLEGSFTTLALQPTSQPTALSFSNTGTNSTELSFTAAAGSPTGYIVLRNTSADSPDTPQDGVIYTTSIVIGNSAIVYVGPSNMATDIALASGTQYYYTVFAFNGSGGAQNYMEASPLRGETITVPSAPVAKQASNQTPSSFTSNWDGVTGAVSYEVDLLLSIDNSFIKTQTGVTGIEFTFEGLNAGTEYKYKVRAVNAKGAKSADSNPVTAVTDQTSANALKIDTTPTVSTVEKSFTTTKIGITVSGGSGTKTVIVKHRGIMGKDFATLSTTGTGNNFEATVEAGMVDDLGLEYYIEASDASGKAEQSSHSFLYKSITTSTAPTIPFASGLNGKQSTYQMFSIPFQLNDNDINKIFDVALSGQDKTIWRLFHFTGGESEDYKEYPNQFLEVKPGEGYWFNTISADFNKIKVGAGSVVNVKQGSEFEMTLVKGWNQIGNPYPFDLDWTKVVGSNQNLGSLHFFNNGNYESSNTFKVWSGAFVHADESMTLKIPITSNPSERVAKTFSTNIDAEQWLLPINISVNELSQEAGIGMHPEASVSKDRFDEITVPRFMDYVELNTWHNEFFAHKFSTDVVPTNDNNEWNFTVQTSVDGRGEISWDLSHYPHTASSLILIDLASQEWVDMKTSSKYTFSGNSNRPIRIIYNREGEFDPGITMLGQSYPNPFRGDVGIPVLVSNEQLNISIEIVDMLGRRIRSIPAVFDKPGSHVVHWNGRDEGGNEVSNGMLLYRVSGLKNQRVAKKMIKQ